MTMPIFVINLAESTHRRKRIQEQLDNLGLRAEFFPAIKGTSLDSSELSAHYDNNSFFRPLSLGEIGCALSHISIYKLIIDRNIEYGLILEDDVLLSNDVTKIINSLVIIIKPNIPEIILLTSLKEYSDNNSISLNADNYRIVSVIRAECAHGYIVTNAGARALYHNFYPIRKPADWWELAQHIITIRGIDPYLIDWDITSLDSTLTPGRINSKKHTKKLSYYYKKVCNRFSARLLWWRLRWKHGVVIRTILGRTSSHT